MLESHLSTSKSLRDFFGFMFKTDNSYYFQIRTLTNDIVKLFDSIEKYGMFICCFLFVICYHATSMMFVGFVVVY